MKQNVESVCEGESGVARKKQNVESAYRRRKKSRKKETESSVRRKKQDVESVGRSRMSSSEKEAECRISM